MKLFSRFCVFVAVATVIFLLYLVWFRFNLFQYDIAGHMSSAAAFGRGLYHQFNDASFMGYVHDLFYPPLEDCLIYLLRTMLPIQSDFEAYMVSYKIYCSFLIISFYCGMYRISRHVPTDSKRAFFWVIGLWISLSDKTGTLNYQGNGFYDLFVIGLSTQILSFIFFIYFLDALLAKKRWPILSIWVALILASHLVVGLVCAIFMFFTFFEIFKSERMSTNEKIANAKTLFWGGFFGAGLTAFFWIPFIAHRQYLTSSMIFSNYAVWPLVAIFTGYFAIKRNRNLLNCAVLFFIFILLGQQIDSGFLKGYGLAVPVFHYYRFGIFSIWFAHFAYSLEPNEPEQNTHEKYLSYIFPFAFGFIIMFGFTTLIEHIEGRRFNPISLEGIHEFNSALKESEAGELNRYLVQTSYRSSDFSLESVISVDNPSFASNKGLYWESQRSNVLLSSYAATFFGLPVVLDYMHFNGAPCEIKKCMFKTMVQDYGLSGVLVDKQMNGFNNMKTEEISCFKDLWAAIDKDVQRPTRPTLRFEDNRLELLKFPAEMTGSTISELTQYRLKPYSMPNRSYFYDLVRSREQSCREPASEKSLFVLNESLEKSQFSLEQINNLAKTTAKHLSFKKESSGHYFIEVDAESDVAFWIHLSMLPGWHLRNDQGVELNLIEAFPGMIAIGHGHLRLDYEKTTPMKIGYLISTIFSFLILIFSFFIFRRKAATEESL